MKIFSTIFRDFGKNMVGKRYFQHKTVPVIAEKTKKQNKKNPNNNNEKSGFEIIMNGISVFRHLLKKLFFAFNTFQVFGTLEVF